MIRAAAVLIYFPSPSGFLGTGVIGKLSSVRRGVATTTIVLEVAEGRAAVREEKFLGPWVEFIRGGGILKMTPLRKSRFIQQPSGSFSADHPPCPLTATLWPAPSQPPAERMAPDQRLDDLSQVRRVRYPLSPLTPAPDHRLHPLLRSRRVPSE
jgi:hypothetical protein